MEFFSIGISKLANRLKKTTVEEIQFAVNRVFVKYGKESPYIETMQRIKNASAYTKLDTRSASFTLQLKIKTNPSTPNTTELNHIESIGCSPNPKNETSKKFEAFSNADIAKTPIAINHRVRNGIITIVFL